MHLKEWGADGVSTGLDRWRDMVNLALEKRVTMEDNGKGEIGSEIGKVIGMVEDVPTPDSLGKRDGVFNGRRGDSWRNGDITDGWWT